MTHLSPVTVPYLMVASVIGLAGIAKLRDGRLTVAAAKELGLDTAASYGVRALAAVELGLAAMAWTGLSPHITSAAIALFLAAFAAIGVRFLLRKREISCGCFGVRSVRVTGLHVALNVVASLVCALAVVWPVDLGDTPRALEISAVLFQIAVGTYLLVLAYTGLDDHRHRAGRSMALARQEAA